jgi:hypothetical protein
MANSQVQIQPLPTPPTDQGSLFTDPKSRFTESWNRWFLAVQKKVNVINQTVANLSSGGIAAILPLTTKGDILTYDTAPDRLPVGTDGYVLSADSTQPTGLLWKSVGSSSLPLTTKGDILGYNTAPARIPVGADNYVLTADSTQALGVSWKPSGNAVYDSVVLADAPVGYWKLAETSGTVANDSSGNAINGTYHGTFTLLGANGPANLPGGVLLSGTASYVSIPANTLLNVGNNWSVEAWCFGYTISTGVCLVTEAYVGGSDPVSLALGFNFDSSSSTSSIMGGFYTGSGWVRAVGPALANAHLYHAVITYDNTALYLYINGALIASIATSAHVASNNGLYLGTQDSGGSSFFSGILSCCALYNTTLSASRIKAHYVAGR